MQQRVVDLDDAFILLEEIVLLRAAVFLNAFNMEAQRSGNMFSEANTQDRMLINIFFLLIYR